MVAEQEDVTSHALDCEVLVHLSDARLGRFLDDVEVGGVGYRAAAGDRGEPGASPPAYAALHAVVVQVGRAPPASRRDTFTEHLEDFVEVLALEIPVRPGTSREPPEILGRHLVGRGDRD